MDTRTLLDADVNVSSVVPMPPSSIVAPPRPAPALSDRPLVSGAVVAREGADPASCLAGSLAEGMGLIVAPSIGRFRPLVGPGRVPAGAVVGIVTGGGGRADEVRVPVPAVVHGVLARDGQLVQRGQALAWIRCA